GAAVTVKVANRFAVTAAAALASVQPTPPHALAAPVPEVPTPDPRVNAPTVTFGDEIVGAKGDVPKSPNPPGSGCMSQPAIVVAAVAVNCAAKPVKAAE